MDGVNPKENQNERRDAFIFSCWFLLMIVSSNAKGVALGDSVIALNTRTMTENKITATSWWALSNP